MIPRSRAIILTAVSCSVLIMVAFIFRVPLDHARDRLSLYTTYREGGNFYRNAARSTFAADERWLYALLFDHMKASLRGKARGVSGDPFDKVLGERFRSWKVFPFSKPVSMGSREGYAVATQYRPFMEDPLDDIVLRSLYCDVYGYSDADFRVLGSLSPDRGYTDTHVLLSLLFLRENGCFARPERDAAIAHVSERVVRAAGEDKIWSDLFSERVVFLYWAGEGERVKPEWISAIARAQQGDGGWADPLWGETSNPHSTGLSMLALRYFLEGGKSVRFLSPLE